ncbi:MAG: SDR family oxidoreductase [Actinobacteria bacterium]|jgi:NAD(P)-dependent dehydrogenase (short-subunit alcohol dehydrogenase family)|nr:SDR family oxidoreductase [Actinomycetota bacterium]
MDMTGKVAVVTGGGRGNGEAIARRLAQAGAHVVIGDINADDLARVVADIEREGGKATGRICDVSDPDQVEALFQAADELGGPNAVVAQAGAVLEATLESIEPDAWDRFMSVDVKGTYLCVRAAIPRMRALGGGSIVTMSGTYAYLPEKGVAAQAAAKAAIMGMTKAVAVEVGPDNIRVNCIVPGYIETPLVKLWADTHRDPEGIRQAAADLHALGRMGRPDEIGAMALFLCSDESSFSTGHPYHVDGGLAAGLNYTSNIPD